MAFAKGTYAVAQCDRCGFKVSYKNLKREWNGWWVCNDCWEPKHPNLEPKHVGPVPEALQHPRPDRDDPGNNDEIIADAFEMTFGGGT
jgi:hypothetical protein